MDSTIAAYRAFRAEMMSSPSEGGSEFTDFESRRLRYAVAWSFFENTAYQDIHSWAVTYRTRFGLYKYLRDIYSPAQRIASFARDHIWGGSLDPLAGLEGCLPIVTDNERLRLPISTLWTWSNWGIVKDIVTLQGAVMGDALLRVVDDVATGKVYLEQIHPGTVSALDKDRFGNIKGYVIEERRLHPVSGKAVDYKETCERGPGEEVIFRTYLGKALFAWNGDVAEWSEPYGFVPMVHIQHNNVGLGWGQSEFHAAYSKINEANDQGSMLSDQIRKSVNPKWLFSGVKDGATAPARTSTTPTATHPQPGREEADALYASDPQAKAQPLVAPLDIAGALSNIQKVIDAIENEYPELKFDELRAQGKLSGVALRVARQPIETKVNQRRANYDNALVRAQQMAVAIGGWRGLPEFAGFGLDSFDQGALNHSIGPRTVFSVDPIDKVEESRVFWEAAKVAKDAGATLDAYLKDAGWDDERIGVFLNSPEYKAKQAAARAAVERLAAGPQDDRDTAPANGTPPNNFNGNNQNKEPVK